MMGLVRQALATRGRLHRGSHLLARAWNGPYVHLGSRGECLEEGTFRDGWLVWGIVYTPQGAALCVLGREGHYAIEERPASGVASWRRAVRRKLARLDTSERVAGESP